MYRIEIEHEGHWLVGRDSGIGDLGREYATEEEARGTIRACADTERMEGRVMPRARIVSDMSAAAATLGRRGGKSTSERKAAAARANGRLGGRPKRE